VKSTLSTHAIAAGLIVLGTALSSAVPSAAASVVSLRGASAPPTTTAPPATVEQKVRKGSFKRSYAQQPPLIPHDISSFEITRENNQCLQCHGPTVYKDMGAPEVGASHFRNRQGKTLDHVVRGRWFCNQCHIPQMDTHPLVRNDFRGDTAKP